MTLLPIALITREQFLEATKPMNERLDSLEYKEHRACVSMELEFAALKTERFGWARMNARTKDRLTKDWTDTLAPFTLEEIQSAIIDCLDKAPRLCPNEREVKTAILKHRRRVFEGVPKRIVPEKPKQLPSAEVREQIMREAGFHLKRFGG